MNNDTLEITFSKLVKQTRSGFDCGSDVLNNYFRISAGQEIKKSISITYVMAIGDKVIGYYTLSNNSIDLSDLPDSLSNKIPKYPKIPVTLIGRLAIDKTYQGKGYGTLLLANALEKCVSSASEIGSFAVIVDAKDSKAEDFYKKYGFISFEERRKLYLPMTTIIKAYTLGISAKNKVAKKS